MEKIILLHGIFIPKQQLAPLASFLSSQGYQVANIGYPSTKKRLQELARDLLPTIQQEIDQTEHSVNFVTFSMGGLMIRELLPKLSIPNPGRLVMIAPPNQGSPVATLARKLPIVSSLYGPALRDIENTEHINQIVNLETGIIAGEFKHINLGWFILKEASDGEVAVASTKLQNATDHIILNFIHGTGPLKKEVQEQTLYFLQNGNFKRNP